MDGHVGNGTPETKDNPARSVVVQREGIVVEQVYAAGREMLFQQTIHVGQRIVRKPEVPVEAREGHASGLTNGFEWEAELISHVVDEEHAAAVTECVEVSAQLGVCR